MPLTRAHLVGSLPYPDADTAFAETAARLGGHLKRIPDGETGERARWIFWQRAKLANHPAMEVAAGEDKARIPPVGRQADPRVGAVPLPPGRRPGGGRVRSRLRAGGDRVHERFRALRAAGTLPADIRFQVCLPNADGGRLLVRRARLPARFLRLR